MRRDETHAELSLTKQLCVQNVNKLTRTSVILETNRGETGSLT